MNNRLPAVDRRLRCVRLTLAAASALGCVACGSLNPPSSATLGLSLRDATAAQTRKPGTGERAAAGLDGAAARAALQRYEQSFEAPSRSAPVFNIGIGASSSR